MGVEGPSTLEERLERVTKALAKLDKKIARGYQEQEDIPARQARLREDAERYEDASLKALSDTTSQEKAEYIDGLLQEIEEMENSPAFRQEAPFYLGVFLEDHLPPLGGVLAANDGTTLVIGVDYPGRSLHEASLILQGGASSTLTTSLGYARLADIAFELYNYGNLHGNRGQTMAWHTDKGFLQKVFNTLLINRTMVEADQDHKLETEYAYSIGLFDTIRALPGFLDDITFHKATRLWKLTGNLDRSFPFDNDGVVLEHGMYPMAFRYYAANKPIEASDTVFFEIYDVEDTETKYIANDESGFEQDEDAIDEADAENEAHYKGTAKGIAARILPNAQIKAWHVYTSRAFFTKASILSEADERDHELGDPVVRMLSSKQALANERALVEGETVDGQKVYGALRHPISGEVMELVTDLQDISFLQETAEGVLYQPREMGSELTEDEREEYQPEEGSAKVVDVGRDYVVDEVRRPINAIMGIFGLEAKVKGQADTYDPFSRPAFTDTKALSDVQTEVGGLIFEASGVLKRMRSSGEEKAGWVHHLDDGTFNDIESTDALEEVEWLTQEQMDSIGATRHRDGRSMVVEIAGQDVLISGSALIQLPDSVEGKKFGVFEPSIQTKRQWLRDLKKKQPELAVWLEGMESYGVSIPVKGVKGEQTSAHSLDGFLPAEYVAGAVGQEVEIEQENGDYEKVTIDAETMIHVDEDGDVVSVLDPGRKAYEEHAIVLQTLITGGTEVENRVDGEFVVYAKGNRLTPEQARIGVRPERELVELMEEGRLERQHVERDGLHAYVAAQDGVAVPGGDRNGIIWLFADDPAVKHTIESGEDVVLKALTRPVILSDEGRGFPDLQHGIDYADTLGTSVVWNAFSNPSNGEGSRAATSGVETNLTFPQGTSSTVEEFLSKHWFVIGEEGQSHGFVSLSQLQTPEVHEQIRSVASRIQMQDIDENITGRVYLNPNIFGSRVEIKQNANESLVFELMGLDLQNLSNPVAEVFRFSDEAGLLHVQTTELRAVNEGIVVEDVYRVSAGEEPTLLYSIRALQGDIIHFKDGHEQYSVAVNPEEEPGLDVEIDGESVRHVTGLFQFDEDTGIGYHVNLKGFDKSGDYPPIRRTTFTDRHRVNDQNGFVEIERGWTVDQINEAVRNGVFGTEDAYSYNSRGEVLEREVSLKAHGKADKAWIIKGGEIKAQPELVLDVKRAVNVRLPQIAEDNPGFGVLPEFVLDEQTVLVEAFTETVEGVKTTDYRIWGDALEKKFITVRSEGDRIIDMVVGLEFDSQTGAQTLAVRLSPDMQVKAIRRTAENDKTIKEILPPAIEETYADLITRRFPGSDTRLLQEMKSVGVTPYLVPTRVEEYPLLILSDEVEQEGYSFVDERVRPLMEQYAETSDENARTRILKQVEQIVRENREGKARYRILYGLNSGSLTNTIDLGNVNSAIISGLQSGPTYTLAVVALAGGNQSLAEDATIATQTGTAISIIDLFDGSTPLEAATTVDTPTALYTYIADRARDRHAREAVFNSYDHYLAWYWEQRIMRVEIIDRVGKNGGTNITVNYTVLTPLSAPEFRAFYLGVNTLADYHYNVLAPLISTNASAIPGETDYNYSQTVTWNEAEGRALQVGDRMELEISMFLLPRIGRNNYYATAMLYVVGQGIVPWEGIGPLLDSYPLSTNAWLGGLTTLPYQYSNEPEHLFKQLAGNMSPTNAHPFMLGRRLHHTDFGDGSHSEAGNPAFTAHIGKLGPKFIASSCVDCHVNNGRALPPAIGTNMFQTVMKVGDDSSGTPHPTLGSVLQPQDTSGPAEGSATIASYILINGLYGDGMPYELRKPVYTFTGTTPAYYSARLAPPLVGMGLLEAISESSIMALADPDDADMDGISGRVRWVTDPETGQTRVGRFGYKGSRALVSHQVAGALNTDMGVTTPVFPILDGETTGGTPELTAADIDLMTRYVALLGVQARRDLGDAQALKGEALFTSASCVDCHTPQFTTSPYHPMTEVRSQTIHPYSDLLLHDMGPGLADNMGEGAAAGSEWRTAPLWNIGHTPGVSEAGEAYLHDGRARTLEEAILWHDGEAEASKEAFRNMSAADRAALIKFLKSL